MRLGWLAVALLAASPLGSWAYPLDGAEPTGIRRLEHARLVEEGQIPGRRKLRGERLEVEDVDIRLGGHRELRLPEPEPGLSAAITSRLGGWAPGYSVAVLDLSDPEHAVYAEHRGGLRQTPGSVGKVLVSVALFQALADAYPDDEPARLRVLRQTRIAADEFIAYDSHRVSLFDPVRRSLERRPLRIGDEGNLWEYLDWTLSASSNAAASMLMKHAMLLVHYGRAYPVEEAKVRQLFSHTPPAALRALYTRTFVDILARSGVDPGRLRQGSFFTATGKAVVPGQTSYATAREFVKLLLALEQGRVVDTFSSREIKRLLYVTERRVRYAAAPALRDAAVYFKSGSLFVCEPPRPCDEFRGNKLNIMNSIAIVESPARRPRLHYLVAVSSNLLGRDSAVDHEHLATEIHALIEARHPSAPASP